MALKASIMPLYSPDRQDRDRETGTQDKDRERET